MRPCACRELHATRRIVLTGGPGAGKTAVLELIRQTFCEHVRVLPESAGILFGGGFPRSERSHPRNAAQRAIFFVQRELETTVDDENLAVVLCDRGTVDGAAYWAGPDTLFASVGTTLDEQLARYDAVIHLRTPSAEQGYDRSNPLRIEAADDAARIDARIATLWQRHPNYHAIAATSDFTAKATLALRSLQAELPDCCKRHEDSFERLATERARSR